MQPVSPPQNLSSKLSICCVCMPLQCTSKTKAIKSQVVSSNQCITLHHTPKACKHPAFHFIAMQVPWPETTEHTAYMHINSLKHHPADTQQAVSYADLPMSLPAVYSRCAAQVVGHNHFMPAAARICFSHAACASHFCYMANSHACQLSHLCLTYCTASFHSSPETAQPGLSLPTIPAQAAQWLPHNRHTQLASAAAADAALCYNRMNTPRSAFT
jgi:hypothetical protein